MGILSLTSCWPICKEFGDQQKVQNLAEKEENQNVDIIQFLKNGDFFIIQGLEVIIFSAKNHRCWFNTTCQGWFRWATHGLAASCEVFLVGQRFTLADVAASISLYCFQQQVTVVGVRAGGAMVNRMNMFIYLLILA